MDKYSFFDAVAIQKIRENVDAQIRISALLNDLPEYKILDIAPQDHAGARKYFQNAEVKTLDISTDSSADFIADLCADNSNLIHDNEFDYVICTEVLEHTLRPWDAVKEIHRITKQFGTVLVTTPLNFRIHGPSPDCYRFTDRGLRELFKEFDIIELSEVESDRKNFPCGYTLRAMKL